jgi:hypothetical protein
MIVAIHQPNYFPWLGYFHKLLHSDVFVLLDHVQLSKSSYTPRVQILCQGKPSWLSVPVLKSGKFGQAIYETECDTRSHWQAKHLKTLQANYARHPYWGEVFQFVEPLLSTPASNLAHINVNIVRELGRALGAQCRFVRSSELPLAAAQRDDMLVEITKLVGGDRYLHGSSGARYQETSVFENAGIQPVAQDFRHRMYPQHCTAEFTAGLSVLDCLFNLGFEGTRSLLA